jgi:hypothetical protein
MHRPRSLAAMYRLRLAAFLWCVRLIVLPAAIGIMLYGASISHQALTWIGVGVGVLGGLLTILQWIIATKARCPLCAAQVLANQGCSRHRRAKKLFGSHRTRVAMSIVFRNRFSCPNCNEPTQLQLRDSVNPRNH